MIKKVVTKENVKNQIQPGVIYLTIGTPQQIKCLLADNVVIEHHYNPTTNLFRQWLLPNPIEDKTIARIIYYNKVSATGRLRCYKNVPKDKYGTVSETSIYAIPNDQSVTIPSYTYFFVTLINPLTGEIEKKGTGALIGDYIEELDLRNVTFIENGSKEDNLYPITATARKNVKDSLLIEHYSKGEIKVSNYENKSNAYEESIYFKQLNTYIKALLKPYGANVWYNLGKSGEAYKLFLSELATYKDSDFKTPYILKITRAWCLQVYLEFFLVEIRSNRSIMPIMLAKFANWVYITSTALSIPEANGLYWFASSSKSGYWVFRPSREAKLCLLKYFD